MRNIILILAASLGVWGCTVTGRLERRARTASVSHIDTRQRETRHQNIYDQFIPYTRADSTIGYLGRGVIEADGEHVSLIEIDQVVVVAKSRSVAERMGRLNLDFIVTIPRNLQGRFRSIGITPVLHRQSGKSEALEELTIRGGLFNRVQQRDYWRWDRYLHVHNPDSLKAAHAFERFIRFPYPEQVRLDSILEGRENISYFYSQEVAAQETEKRLKVTLSGQVTGMDGSRYLLPSVDTVEYTISSMLQLLDTTTRYLTRIIEKYAVVQDKNFLNFRVGDARLIDTLGNNRQQLDRIESMLENLIDQYEYHIDSITLTATASPEGYRSANESLARSRAFSLRDHLNRRFPDSGLDSLLSVR